MGNAFADLTSISRGEAAARRDIIKIKAFNDEHRAKHEADEDYECGGDIREFWGTLGLDVKDCGNEIQIGGYKRLMNKFIAESGDDAPKISYIQIDPDTIDADDPEGSILKQVFEAIEVREAFDALVNPPVSETTNDQEGTN